MVSTLRSAVPPVGHTVDGPNFPCSTLSATALPLRKAAARSALRPWCTRAVMSTLAYGVITVCWPDVAFLRTESQLAAALLAGSDMAPKHVDVESAW